MNAPSPQTSRPEAHAVTAWASSRATADILILGASARAAAESARRANLVPHTIDLFADRDLSAIAASAQRCPMPDYPHGLIALANQWPGLPVLFVGAMENHLDVAKAIARDREWLGPSIAAMRAARAPDVFANWPRPAVRHDPPTGGNWLIKPHRSAGGRGVRRYTPGTTLDDGHYLQQHIAGRPLGAVYHSGQLLGVSEQIVGDPSFGAHDFLYVGSVGPIALPPRVHDAFVALGRGVAQRCELRGLFGIDVILDDADQLWPLEVNPRYTASVELLERATGLVALSARPSRSVGDAVLAKGIVYAQRDVIAPDLLEPDISDVPTIGETIPRGRPICTLWSQGRDRDAALEQLRAAARRLYDRLHA